MEHSLLEKLVVAQLFKKFPLFMDAEYSLPHSFTPTLSKVNSVHTFTPYSIKIHFNITLILCPRFPNVLFPSFVGQKLRMHFPFPMLATNTIHLIFQITNHKYGGTDYVTSQPPHISCL
jgi:hypothetical protein